MELKLMEQNLGLTATKGLTAIQNKNNTCKIKRCII